MVQFQCNITGDDLRSLADSSFAHGFWVRAFDEEVAPFG
jgi:hypothetical protein